MTVLACLLVSILAADSAQADTLTLRNNAEINGKISYEHEDFVVRARYPGGTKTITFQRNEVRTLEVNGRDFNPAESPTDLSFFAARPTGTGEASRQEAVRKEQHGGARAPKQGKRSGSGGHSVLNFGGSNPSTTDVVWLRDNGEVRGRLVQIEAGQLTIETGRGTQELDLERVARVLVAPD